MDFARYKERVRRREENAIRAAYVKLIGDYANRLGYSYSITQEFRTGEEPQPEGPSILHAKPVYRVHLRRNGARYGQGNAGIISFDVESVEDCLAQLPAKLTEKWLDDNA